MRDQFHLQHVKRASPYIEGIDFNAGVPAATDTASQKGRASPPLRVWQSQPDQTFATSDAGTFALKRIEITPQQFRFYYVYRFTTIQYNRLRASANSLLLLDPPERIPLTATVQTLGLLDSYTVGVLHVARRSQTGQVIEVAITPVSSVTDGPTWHLSPMKQLRVESHADRAVFGLATNSSGLPEVEWSPSLMAQKVSYVKAIIPGQAVAERSYLFVRSDDPAKVDNISKEEYIEIAGPSNFIS